MEKEQLLSRWGALKKEKQEEEAPVSAPVARAAVHKDVEDLVVVRQKKNSVFPKLDVQENVESGIVAQPEVKPHDDIAVREQLKRDFALTMKR